MKATLKNDFHGTEVNVIVPKSGVLSARQTARVKKELCGISECRCGIVHGEQDFFVDETINLMTGKYAYVVCEK